MNKSGACAYCSGWVHEDDQQEEIKDNLYHYHCSKKVIDKEELNKEIAWEHQNNNTCQ